MKCWHIWCLSLVQWTSRRSPVRSTGSLLIVKRAVGRIQNCAPTLGYALLLPGRKSGFRAGFKPDSNRESVKIGPPAGRRPAGLPMLRLSLLESGRNPARKPSENKRNPAMTFVTIAVMPYFRSCNKASGPEIGLPGRISAGFYSEKHQNRASGRPKAGRRAEF